ncbi:hypothetical protein [Brevibacillus laterosporus]|uniref:hypothetical protein n=1 Tax=Brevibacillus laterosporus TaxID=1465 RepID=UPI001596A686|nr:hypothetical protein [Brevibacillus laterosporus]
MQNVTVSPGADYKIEVCNNVFDESPTWKTQLTMLNSTVASSSPKRKTAEKWGVSVRFVFVKGVATESVIVKEFGGAFD